jgi:KUP system potassium uptake protein
MSHGNGRNRHRVAAFITGAFSVAHQAVQLGYLPRLRIVHTSEETAGQIYVPWINWLLMVSVLTLVVTFKTSAALAFAFGMAVTGTITITTLLFCYFVRQDWHRPLWLVAIGAGSLLSVDLLFLAANVTKLTHGAWLPLVIGVTTFTVLTTWQRGRELVTRRRERAEGLLREFIDNLHERKPTVARVPGTAVFLNRNKLTAPLAMRASVDHLHALGEHLVILLIETVTVSHVPSADRIAIDDLGSSAARARGRRAGWSRPRSRRPRDGCHSTGLGPASREQSPPSRPRWRAPPCPRPRVGLRG